EVLLDRAGADAGGDGGLQGGRPGGRVGQEADEPVEQVGGVVRACRGLGVVLNGEGGQVEAREAFDDLVVEADVGDDDAAVAGRVVPGGAPGLVVGRLRHGGCAGRVDDGGVDGEAVVVRGDLDLAGGAVEHGLVDAAVAVAELVGAVPEGAAE